MEELLHDLKSIIGLFVPVRWERKTESGEMITVYQGSIEVGNLPIGLIFVLAMILVNLIMK